MDDKWKLPYSIELNGELYDIRTDFRVILDILQAMSDPELTEQEKNVVMLQILYCDPNDIPEECLEEALLKGKEFIDSGISEEEHTSRIKLMDWEQDSPIIAPAINKNIGKDIRSLKYMHWWTFMGAYLEIYEGLFHQVLMIRQKKAKNQKLEKWEAEFYRNNKTLIDLKNNSRERSQEEKDALREVLGYRKKTR